MISRGTEPVGIARRNIVMRHESRANKTVDDDISADTLIFAFICLNGPRYSRQDDVSHLVTQRKYVDEKKIGF